jgi:uncharacterized protein
MVIMVLAYIAALAAQPAEPTQPVSGAEAAYRQAETLKTKEPLRARTLYETAARQGYAPAQSALGILLFKDGNRSGALRWLKMAADSGEPHALLIYGTAQFNGDGVPPNRIQGYAMVRQAAAQGLADALATQSEMELVMPKSERDAATKLATGPETAKPEAEAEVASAPASAAAPKVASRSKTPNSPKTEATSSKPATRTPAKPAPPKTTSQVSTTGEWRIQLGAFRQPGAGQALFARLSPRLPGKQANFVPLGSLTRVLVGPYASLAEASAACRALGRQQPCMPIKR